MNWKSRVQQVTAIARLELRRFVLARRWAGVYFLAFAPALVVALRSQRPMARLASLESMTSDYLNFFQYFQLRFGLFISCAVVFSQLFRGDILEKTLHLYLLTPARREVLAIGKYTAAVVFVAALLGTSTIATHVGFYWPHPSFSTFFFEGPGLSHLVRYVVLSIFAVVAYGALFLLVGVLFKNPGVPTFFLMAWESLSFALPTFLQQFSISYYLQVFSPGSIDRGPFAVVVEPPSAILGVLILLIMAATFVAAAGWFVRQMQITYSAD